MRQLAQLTAAALAGVFALYGCSQFPTEADTEPAANAGPDQTLTDLDDSGAESVTLDGSASTDPDGAIETWVWNDDGAEIATGETATANLPVGMYVIRLTVTDSDGNSAVDDMLVTVLASASAGLTADAGPDQTVTDTNGNGTESVTLNGTGSRDPSRTISSYVWREGGNQIAVGATPRVTLGVGTHTITLSVTNHLGETDADDVVVTVVASGGNQSPVASAGPDQTLTDSNGNGTESVTLNGSGSFDPDGSIGSWVWREAGGQIATGSSPTTTLGVGSHSITLTVTDNQGATDTDAVVITINSSGGNQPPVANAGPDQTVTDTNGNGSEVVAMDGSGSFDPDGQIQWAEWSENGQIIGNGQKPNLTLGVGQHTITLRIGDNGGAVGSDDVIVTVNAPGGGNQSPTASAGPDQTVTDSNGNGSESVSLNGTGSSDPDGSITSWVWRENGSQIATGSSPGVTLAVGTHTIVLTVTDDGGATDTDNVVITVNAGGGGVSYANDIQPYFNTRCISCHQNGNADAGVRLHSYAATMSPGNSGAVVVPGNPNQGSLMSKLNGGHKGAPHGTSIIADATSWINAGAPNN